MKINKFDKLIGPESTIDKFFMEYVDYQDSSDDTEGVYGIIINKHSDNKEHLYM